MTHQDERIQLLSDIDLNELAAKCEFDAFAEAASTLCGTSSAMVTVLTEHHQCDLGRIGIDVGWEDGALCLRFELPNLHAVG